MRRWAATPRPGRIGYGTVEAKVQRVTSLGFEVRIELEVEGTPAWVQLAPPVAAALGLAAGDIVWLSLPERGGVAVGTDSMAGITG